MSNRELGFLIFEATYLPNNVYWSFSSNWEGSFWGWLKEQKFKFFIFNIFFIGLFSVSFFSIGRFTFRFALVYFARILVCFQGSQWYFPFRIFIWWTLFFLIISLVKMSSSPDKLLPKFDFDDLAFKYESSHDKYLRFSSLSLILY